MKYRFILFGLLHTILSYTQVNNSLLKPENLLEVTKSSGRFLIGKVIEPFEGFKYSFNTKITNVQIDTAYHNLLVFGKFKNASGFKEVISYNINSDSITWRYRTLSQNCAFLKNNIALIYQEAVAGENKIFLLDRLTGKPKLFTENADIFLEPDFDLIYIFPRNSISRKMEIIEGKSGFVVNSIKIPSEYAYSSSSVNDSCLYMNINGILALNKNYKKIWDHRLNTMQLDLKSVLISAGVGIGIGLLTGFVPVYNAPANYSANLNSNLHFQKESLIISDKDSLYSFNKKTGEVFWSQRLPFKTGLSKIIQVNDSITAFFNSGICFKNGGISDYGTPYYSLFSNKKGRILFAQLFKESKLISDIKVSNDTALILFNNGICKIKGNDIIKTKVFESIDILGTIRSFYSKNSKLVYLMDSTQAKWFKPDSLQRSNKDIMLITDKGLVILNNDFALTNFIPIRKAGKLLYENETYQYVEAFKTDNNNQIISRDVVIYNKLNRNSYELLANDPYVIDNENLYIRKEDSYYVLKLR